MSWLAILAKIMKISLWMAREASGPGLALILSLLKKNETLWTDLKIRLKLSCRGTKASLSLRAGRFKSYSFANPEDRFSRDVAHSTVWRQKSKKYKDFKNCQNDDDRWNKWQRTGHKSCCFTTNDWCIWSPHDWMCILCHNETLIKLEHVLFLSFSWHFLVL